MINDWTGKCPLTNKPCNNDKIILAVKTENGVTTKFAICTDCASNFDNLVSSQGDAQWRNFLETIFSGMHISQLFDQMEMEQVINSIKGYDDLNNFMQLLSSGKSKKKMPRKCKDCGITIEDVMKDGKFGCPKCYDNLQPFSSQLVFRTQDGKVQHVGKAPKNQAPKQEDSLDELQKKMAEAIKEERYEDAATLRDAIKELKQKNEPPTTV